MLHSLNRAINFLRKLLDELYCPKVDAELKRINADIDMYLLKKTQTLIFLSKARYYSEGERNTKYFFSMAKSQATRRTMYEVYDERGKKTKNPDDILTLQCNYY